ncbi:MAG: amino acid adenylation domain-containing protein [bacterium]
MRRVGGDYTSTLLLEMSGQGARFLDRARAAQAQLTADLAHAAVSGIEAGKAWARSRGRSPRSIAPVVFSSLLRSSEVDAPWDWLGERTFAVSQTAQVWIDFQLIELRGGLELTWDVARDLFPAGMNEAMFDAYVRLLDALVDRAVWDERVFDVRPEPQRLRHAAANATAGPRPDERLFDGFRRQARARPEAPAMIAAARTLSYGELDHRARALAVELRDAGAGPGELVALVMHKGWPQVVAALAIHYAGAAYLPLSAAWPAERRAWMASHAGACAVITTADLVETLGGDARPVVVPEVAPSVAPAIEPPQSPADLAYVIYTSGSTGKPKGVALCHRAAVNTIADINRRFGVGPDDRVFGLSSLSFDLSVYDIFGPLAVGGALVLPGPGTARAPDRWLVRLAETRVTVWNTVPALFEMLVTQAEVSGATLPEALRLVMMSGDWIPVSLPGRARALSGAALISLGGATEAAIWSIAHPIVPADGARDSVPYGRPLTNQTFHVLDGAMSPRPDGVAGGLYIGGAGLAEGYWNDPERTAASFVRHPDTGERLYRTGDLGRYLPDGEIEFLGRSDSQVKVLGHRIELGEIEAWLRRDPSVAAAVVGAPGPRERRRLVGYVVPAPGADFDSDALADALRINLPDYMVPRSWVVLDALPLSANGKVDRGALPTPGPSRPPGPGASPSGASPLEAALIGVWSSVLGAEVQPESAFFDLGGDSLMAIRLVAEIGGALGLELPLRGFLEAPTVRGMAALLAPRLTVDPAEAARALATLGARPEIPADPAHAHDPFALTDVQQAYWVGRGAGHALGGVSAHMYQEFEGARLDAARLAAAWDRLVAAHPMLRAVIDAEGRQRVLTAVPPTQIAELDLTGHPDPEQALAAVRAELSHAARDAATWPLCALRLTHLDAHRSLLHFSADLLVADGWSVVRLVQALSEAYADPERPVRAPALTFRDYVQWAASTRDPAARAAAEAYWRARLDTLPGPPRLPLAQAPEAIGRPRFERRQFTLPTPDWRALREAAKQREVTPSVALLAAFAATLARWAGDHFCVNLTLFDRPTQHPEVLDVIGDFTTLVLVEVDLRGGGDFAALAGRVQGRLWQDLDHREFGAVAVTRALAAHGRPLGYPVVFTSGIGMAGDAAEAFDTPLWRRVDGITQTPQVWLDFQTWVERGGLVINWDAVEGLFPAGLLDAVFADFRGRLEALADPARWHDAVTVGRPSPAALTPRAPAPSTGAGPVAEVRAIAEALLDRGPIEPDARLLALGVDSVDMIRLAGRLEQAFGWRPEMEALFRAGTLAGIAACYAERETTAERSGWQRIPLAATEADRAAHKAQLATRRAFDTTDGRALPGPAPTPDLTRRSHRAFASTPVTDEALGALLGHLRPAVWDQTPKYRYASGGGIYAVDTLVWLAPGRAASPGGLYGYAADAHRLVRLGDLDAVEPEIGNRGWLPGAAFVLFFVADMRAIAPLYGEASARLALLEAGAMCHLLESEAAACGLGLCQVSGIDFAPVAEVAGLGPDRLHLHALAGGPIAWEEEEL